MYTQKLYNSNAFDTTGEEKNHIKNEPIPSKLTYSEKNFLKTCIHFIGSILDMSSIHGLIYIRRPQLHIFEQYVEI